MNYLKTIIFTTFLIVLVPTVQAQGAPMYLSEGLRSYLVNPASIGTLNKVSLSNRMNFAPWKFHNSPTSFQLNGAFKCLNFGDKSATKIRGAIGFKSYYQRQWYYFQMGFSAQVNLQFDLGNSVLSIGLAPGIENLAFPTAYYYGCFGPSIEYPIFPREGVEHHQRFMLDAGAYWYNEKFALGFSTSDIFRNQLSELSYYAMRTFHLHGSYQQLLSRKLHLKGVFNSETDGKTVNIATMLYAIWGKRELTAGIGYGSGDNLLGGASIRFNALSLGCYLRHNLSGINPVKSSIEYRVAYDLFDSTMQTNFPSGNLSF
ncbi:MAG: hypothetical protein ACI8ZM_004084 [Crocinitomix sp.]|jgi:hypothetical protein